MSFYEVFLSPSFKSKRKGCGWVKGVGRIINNWYYLDMMGVSMMKLHRKYCFKIERIMLAIMISHDSRFCNGQIFYNPLGLRFCIRWLLWIRLHRKWRAGYHWNFVLRCQLSCIITVNANYKQMNSSKAFWSWSHRNNVIWG